MKILTSIMLSFALMLALVAAPMAAAFACGDGGSCSKKEANEKKNCGEKDGDHSKPCSEKKGCGGDCGQKGCHCPQTCSVAQVSNNPIQVTLKPPTSHLSGKAEWYFLNKIPAAVYLSIWLPPKISC